MTAGTECMVTDADGVVLPLTRPARGLTAVHEAISALDASSVSDARALTLLVTEADRAISRLSSFKLDLIAAADEANLASGSGHATTGQWLAAATHSVGADAARDVKLAKALNAGMDATRQALADGTLSPQHARTIAEAATKLPDDVTPAEKKRVEQRLVDEARRCDPGSLRKRARRAVEFLERSRAEVDAVENTQLEDEETTARRMARLTMHDNGDGTTSGHFTVPTLAASMLKKIIGAMSSPSRLREACKDAAAAGDDTVQHEGVSLPVGGRPLKDPMHRSAWGETVDWPHEWGKAFADLLERLDTDKLGTKVAATVVVTMDLESLLGAVRAAHLDTGQDISAGEARRLACNAGIIPAVLGGGSIPIDHGRERRYFTEHHRALLAGVYSTCAAEGCDRPYAWCDLHHEDEWAAHGGETNLDRAVPLCGHHHRLLHSSVFEARVSTDGRGVKTVTFTRRP